MADAQVIIETPDGKLHLTEETPLDIKIEDFINQLTTALEMQKTDAEGNRIVWQLNNKEVGKTLGDNQTLEENGVRNGHRLSLVDTRYASLLPKESKIKSIKTKLETTKVATITIVFFVLLVIFAVIMSENNQKERQIAELSAEMSSLQAYNQPKEEAYPAPTTSSDKEQQSEELAKHKRELNEANSVIISLIVENLRAQNTCDDIHISVNSDKEINITGVSGSRERIAKLKEQVRNMHYVSLNTFDVKYIDINSCVIKVSDDWAIIAQNRESIEEMTFQEGVIDYLAQLPSRRHCAMVGQIIQDNDEISRQFFADGIQPQIWALYDGAVGICRGEENEGVYNWSFKHRYDGYSALLVIKVQQ